jgi:hypothetical protein
VTAQVGRDDGAVRREALGDAAPGEREIGEPVDQDERAIARAVPREDVVVDAGRELEAAGLQGVTSMRYTLPGVDEVVR